jgi:hypothetical protein
MPASTKALAQDEPQHAALVGAERDDIAEIQERARVTHGAGRRESPVELFEM